MREGPGTPARPGGGTDDDAVEVRLRHNCWKHNADLVIRYTGVSGFETTTPVAGRWADLGTLILDEILPHANGCSHELAFWDGTLTVICRDLVAAWVEADCRTGP
ncbi:hypothetical protein [Streptomyces sp. Ac-502]|uniref:hypothetical protein n=1 Tax=Streptomyces sp. Ac-502 TaxID=3342801 RepID=UPI003862966A